MIRRLARLRPRLRTLLALVAVLAVGLGAWIAHERRRERLERRPYDLIRAAEDGDVVRVGELLDEGADVDRVTDGRFPWTPLMHASFRGRTACVKLLLARGADPNRQDLDFYTAITLAAGEGHWEIVRLLVDHGADPLHTDGQSTSALDFARQQGQEEMVRYLESRTSVPK